MQIIPIASGKGGVGKSLLSANLAIALGQAGKKVVLADLDLGASNLHLAIGQNVKDKSIGTYLTEKSSFQSIIEPTEYENVSFIAGDSQIPGLTSLKATQKQKLVRNFHSIDADFLILDLGAGTHQIILDMFLQSPQGILVTSPTVTATLDGYLFIKNCAFRLMYTTFKSGTPGRNFLDSMKKNSDKMKSLYIPRIIENLSQVDPQNAELFKKRLSQFSPRLVLNMIADPSESDRANRIRNSCNQYLGIDLEYLGLIFRDQLQDKALSSRLPVIIYKPNSVISQAIYRIAEKIIDAKPRSFDADFVNEIDSAGSFMQAEDEAKEDYALKLSGIEDLVGSGQLSNGELIEMIKTQSYELSQLKKENLLLKSKLVKAVKEGFKI
ncbi:MAG: MinD/ParA family protein [Treponema sp.]|nr:MinD/ParA family protein [Treponema sp.]MDE6244602.1 P-loop NTPase [Treponemataceae bacterium]MBD5409362.1 MinD/ParA family protein [Treponema sp.]MBD5410401.1 MinD/ParA family protein [Treponema sp.]MBD5412352.1 MinD/ParA family protein [Treponema sp.]